MKEDGVVTGKLQGHVRGPFAQAEHIYICVAATQDDAKGHDEQLHAEWEDPGAASKIPCPPNLAEPYLLVIACNAPMSIL